MAITDLPRGDTGAGSLGPVEGNQRIARIRRCADRMKSHGMETDSAFAVCTVYEQRGALTDEGRPDASKIPGGAEMDETLGSFGIVYDPAWFAEFSPSNPGAVRWVPGLDDDDQPAGGWVENLRRVGDVLMGDIRRLPSTVADAVRKSRLGPRSIEIYREVQRDWRGMKGWALKRLALLGSAIPAVSGLADLGEIDDDGNIDSVELFRAGQWPGSAGPIPINVNDLDDMVENAKRSGLRIPIKLGHGNGPIPVGSFADADGSGEWLSGATTGGETMTDTKQAAAVEAPAVTVAQFAEVQAALETAKRDLARLQEERDRAEITALFSELAQPGPHGAMPVPALRDAGLETLLLAQRGRATYAEGSDGVTMLAKVLRALHKAGFVPVAQPAGTLAADFADATSQEYERLPAAAKSAITLDEFRKGAGK